MRALFALPLLVPSLLAAQAERFTLAGSDIAIYDLAGRLEAVAGTGSDVVVEVTRGGSDAAKLKVETGMIRSRNTLRVIFPDTHIIYPQLGGNWSTTINVNDDGTFNDRDSGRRVKISGSGSGLEASADLKVSVPAGKKLRLNLAVGRVTVSNVNGDIFVDVASADVTTENTKGYLSLDTGSGETRVTKAEGSLDLDSGSGSVTLNGVKGEELKIDAGSGEVKCENISVDRASLDIGSGGITLTALKARRIDLDSGSGDVDIGLTGDVDELRVDSGSGDVTIRIPESLGARLDVDAGSGGVRTELPIKVTTYDSDRLVGTIGDGKGTIRIESGSGTVHLVKATN